MTKVSVLVAVYNVEAYIERCVVSLMEQTLSDVEYIFVDDCSPDRSIDVLHRVVARYPVRQQNVKVIHHEHNRGLQCARLTALGEARGEYIIFVDSDDYVEPDFAEQMYAKACAEEADIVISDVVADKPNGAREVMHDYLSPNPREWFFDLVEASKTLGFLCSKMYRREFITRYMPDEEPRISYLEDISANVRLFFYAQKIAQINRAFYHYVFNCQSLSKSRVQSQRRFRDSEVYYQRVETFLRSQNLHDEYADMLERNKLWMKVHLLFDTDAATRDVFRRQYPEVSLSKHKGSLKLAQLLMLWLTEHRLHAVASGLILMLRLKTKLRR